MKLLSNSSIALFLIVFVIFGFTQNYQQSAMALNPMPDDNKNANFFDMIINFFNNLFPKQNPLQTYKVNTDCELAGVMLSMPSDFFYSPTVQKKYPDEWAKLVKLGYDSKFRYQLQQAEEEIGKELSNTGTNHVALPSDLMEITFSIMSKEYSINPKLKEDYFTLAQGFAPSGFDSNICENKLFPYKTPQYVLNVEPRLEMVMGVGNVVHIYVQNTGSSPLTHVKIDYGNTSDILPVLNPGEKKMFSPPAGTTMVTVTDDQGITVKKQLVQGLS